MTDLRTAIRQHESFEDAVIHATIKSPALPALLLLVSRDLDASPLTVHTEVEAAAFERVVAADPSLLDTREGAL